MATKRIVNHPFVLYACLVVIFSCTMLNGGASDTTTNNMMGSPIAEASNQAGALFTETAALLCASEDILQFPEATYINNALDMTTDDQGNPHIAWISY